jgi:hypothetical protein
MAGYATQCIKHGTFTIVGIMSSYPSFVFLFTPTDLFKVVFMAQYPHLWPYAEQSDLRRRASTFLPQYEQISFLSLTVTAVCFVFL